MPNLSVITKVKNKKDLPLRLVDIDYCLSKTKVKSAEIIVLRSDSDFNTVRGLASFMPVVKVCKEDDFLKSVSGKGVIFLKDEKPSLDGFDKANSFFRKEDVDIAVIAPKDKHLWHRFLNWFTRKLARTLGFRRGVLPLGGRIIYFNARAFSAVGGLPDEILRAPDLGLNVEKIKMDELEPKWSDYLKMWKDLVKAKIRRNE